MYFIVRTKERGLSTRVPDRRCASETRPQASYQAPATNALISFSLALETGKEGLRNEIK